MARPCPPLTIGVVGDPVARAHDERAGAGSANAGTLGEAQAARAPSPRATAWVIHATRGRRIAGRAGVRREANPFRQASHKQRVNVDKKLYTLLDLCVSSLRRGHANLLCIVPILTDDPRRESEAHRWGGTGRHSLYFSPSPSPSPPLSHYIYIYI